MFILYWRFPFKTVAIIWVLGIKSVFISIISLERITKSANLPIEIDPYFDSSKLANAPQYVMPFNASDLDKEFFIWKRVEWGNSKTSEQDSKPDRYVYAYGNIGRFRCVYWGARLKYQVNIWH